MSIFIIQVNFYFIIVVQSVDMEINKENQNDSVSLRPLYCQMGPLTRCDGSVQLNQGGVLLKRYKIFCVANT